jgi:hypothetical protein
VKEFTSIEVELAAAKTPVRTEQEMESEQPVLVFV